MSYRCDPRVRPLADRHYSRQSHGHPNFVPPGRCLVLTTEAADAYWVTSWPYAEYVRHAWGGAWVCSAFRNEGPHRASDLIVEAVQATLAVYGTPPWEGLVTFVDRDKVRPKADPGHTFVLAGFRPSGRVPYTDGGLLALRLAPYRMPEPVAPVGFQRRLFSVA